MKETAPYYDRLASSYDREWRVYLQDTLEKASRYVEASGPLRLLDVGCGTGEFIRRLLKDVFLCAYGAFVGVDASPRMVEAAKGKFPPGSRVTFQVACAQALPFPEGSFDWVTSCNSLHCFRNAPQALGEMVRVLKTKGNLLILDWCRDTWVCRLMNRWCAWFDPTHVWMYTTKELARMLEDKGCLVQKTVRFRVPWPAAAAIGSGTIASWLYGLRLWEMMLFVGIKR